MFEVGEDESGLSAVTDLVWMGGDVVQDAPASCGEGEPTFSPAAQGSQGCVVGAVVDRQGYSAGGCLTGVYTP